jgi:hypothetical protein
MISDCVIALRTESSEQAKALQGTLVEHFGVLAKQYVGTGAPFITLDRLRRALSSVGVAAR